MSWAASQSPQILDCRVPGRHRGQERDGAALGPAGKQVQHQPDHQHRLARAWLTEHDQPAGRHPGQHFYQFAALPGQVIGASRPGSLAAEA